MKSVLLLCVVTAFGQANAQCSASTCDACTSGNDNENQNEICIWCESSKTCSLAYTRSDFNIDDWSSAGSNCAGGRWIESVGQCSCQDEIHDTCEGCTAESGCTWISSGTSSFSLKSTGGGANFEFSVKFTDMCWGGDGVNGPSLPQRSLSGDNFELTLNSEADEWFWSQCGWAGPGLAAIIIVICILAFLGIVGGIGYYMYKKGKVGPH